MKTLTVNSYSFDELSKEAQKKVITDSYEINVDYEWWDCMYDDAAEVGIKITGFDIGRSWDITGELTETGREVCKKIIENHGPACDTFKIASKYYELFTTKAVFAALTNQEEEENPDDNLLEEFTKKILNAYLRLLQEDYEYRTGDEAIKEAIIANEHEFYQDGTPINHKHFKAA